MYIKTKRFSCDKLILSAQHQSGILGPIALFMAELMLNWVD